MGQVSCSHDRAIPGVEGDWCPDCQRVIFPQAVSKPKAFKTRVESGLYAVQSRQTGELKPGKTACGNSDEIEPSESNKPKRPLKQKLKPGKTACGRTEWHLTQLYRSHGSLYYRYIHGRGHQVERYIHIPGGNTDNPIASARREQVDRWIRQGQSPNAIVKMIAKWR